MATLEELLAKQREMAALAERMAGEQDITRLQATSAELQQRAAELSAMAAEIEAQHADARSSQAYTEVVLTDEQRARIREATGVSLESIRLPDEGGTTTRTMPAMDPRIVEYWALKEAERRKVQAEAEAQLAEQLRASIAEIEAQGNEELRRQLEDLKRDPRFFGGLLDKK